MIPESVMDLTQLEETVYPSTTYKLDLQNKTIGKKIDGIELEDLIGKDFEYAESEMQRRIEDALLVDDRFQSIRELTMQRSEKNNLIVSCTVQTVEGAFTVSTEVEI